METLIRTAVASAHEQAVPKPQSCRIRGRASVGLARWPAKKATAIVKLVMEPDARSWLEPLSFAPLVFEVLDDEGEVLYPSDFALYKPLCDLVVGGAAGRHRGPGHFRVGDHLLSFDPQEPLRPRPSLAPGGDPTHPVFAAALERGEIDPSREQIASPARRVPWPTQPFMIDYARADLRFATFFPGPFPRALVSNLADDRPLCRVALALDTITLVPDLRRVVVVFRGVFDAPEEPWWLAVDATQGAGLDPEAARSWLHAEIATPTTLRPPPPARSPSRIGSMTDITAEATPHIPRNPLPFARKVDRSPSSAPPPISDETTHTEPMLELAELAQGLPFAADAGAHERRGLSREELEVLRRDPRVPPAASIEATAVTQRPGGEPARPPRPSLTWVSAANAEETGSVARPMVLAVSGVALTAAPVALRAQSSSEAAHPSPVTLLSATDDAPLIHPPSRPLLAAPPSEPASEEALVKRLLALLWKGERASSEILAEHGLDEESWRALRKRHAKRP